MIGGIFLKKENNMKLLLGMLKLSLTLSRSFFKLLMTESSVTFKVLDVWQRFSNVKLSTNLKEFPKFGKTLLKTIRNDKGPNLVPWGALREIKEKPDESLLGRTKHY